MSSRYQYINGLTYNLGSDERDHMLRLGIRDTIDKKFGLGKYTPKGCDKIARETEYRNHVNSENIEIFKAAFEKRNRELLKVASNLDFLLFMEVYSKINSDLFYSLKSLGFEFYFNGADKKPNCVVALNNKTSGMDEGFAVVRATHKSTGDQIRLVAAYISGFFFDSANLYPVDLDQKDDPAGGDQEVRYLINTLNKLDEKIPTIIGVDLNSDDRVYPYRKSILESKFKILTTEGTTAQNSNNINLPERMIDYVAFDNMNKIAIKIMEKGLPGMTWNPHDDKQNNSDHVPIFFQVMIKNGGWLHKFTRLFTR
jgi:hypothetical protein